MILYVLLLLIIILAPFIIFFCSKWGAFGWFRGKQLAENEKGKNATKHEGEWS